MDWAVLLLLQVMLQGSLSVLLQVKVERSQYEAKFGGHVVFGCRFEPVLSDNQQDLEVKWHWIDQTSNREVYRMKNQVEQTETQHPDYRGRVTLLTKELKQGWVKLKVSQLQINDSGTYQCTVKTENGADYIEMTLSVTAPYKAVTKHLQKVADTDQVLLTCTSEGYPQSRAVWLDGQRRQINSSTTFASTPQKLFRATSQIRVPSAEGNNYTCRFSEDGNSATFHIPDDLHVPHNAKNGVLLIALTIVLVTAAVVGVFMYLHRRKGCSSPGARNFFVNVQDRSADDHLQSRNPENEETLTISNEGCTEENQGALLRAHYSEADSRCYYDAFVAGEPPLRLPNNGGVPVSVFPGGWTDASSREDGRRQPPGVSVD